MDMLDNPPECVPLKTFDAVMKWTPKNYTLAYTAAAVPLKSSIVYPNTRPRTLVCHDMRGGYLQDRFAQGINDDSAFRCFNWQYIDTFIYFSHYFVTTPPPCWTNTCHTHDVLCLGTVITEWDDGKAHCEVIFRSQESYKAFADKLVLIALSLGFDGWLINIENPINEDKIECLVGFLAYLTQEMHESIPGSQVIWYDSVIMNGELKWQDELNDKNQLFFECTDGIFLNYCWNDENLARSTTRAKTYDRPYDVFVGVDVFGRGCFGGGGFNTCKAMEKIRNYDLSAAIFAPGWVYEKHDNFTQEEYKFWSLLVPYLYTKPIRSLPWGTNFCQGQGQQYFQVGKSVCETPWTNLSLQGVQPLIPRNQHMGVDFTDAWSGGGCLTLNTPSNNESQVATQVRLYEFEAELPETTVISYLYKQPRDVLFCLTLTVQKKASKRVLYVLGDKWAMNTSVENDLQVVVVPNLASNDTVPSVCEQLRNQCNGWSCGIFKLNDMVGWKLNDVTAYMSLNSNEARGEARSSECLVKLAHLQISGETVATESVTSDLEVTSSLLEQHNDRPNLVEISCDLSWSYATSEISLVEISRNFTQSVMFHVYWVGIDRKPSGKEQVNTGSHSVVHSIEESSRQHEIDLKTTHNVVSGEHESVATSGNNMPSALSAEPNMSSTIRSVVQQQQTDANGDDAVVQSSCDNVLLGSVMARPVNKADCNSQCVGKYRACGLLVDLNVTRGVRFTVQPVDVLGRHKQLVQCLTVDLPISLD